MSQGTALTPGPAPPIEPGWRLADLLEYLGGIPADRVRLYPWPGTATEEDVVAIEAREGRLCELIDGTLVEKVTGFDESRCALVLGHFLEDFLEMHDLGIVVGADGLIGLRPGLVRIPDLAFLTWERLGHREDPPRPIANVVPDLVVEVLSESNTDQEMDRKLLEYFGAGVRLVWYADPRARVVRAFTAIDQPRTFDAGQFLDGGGVLPGFRLAVRDWFDRASRRGPRGG